jgi:acetoin utilization deacetylase AcuC-like enzyme
MHAQARGVERIAIVDVDVHHGNGAEKAFWSDPSVLTVSIHQDGVYPPGSGSVDSLGSGPGRGFNLNVPLPPGSGTGAYDAAFERVVGPALRAFRPDLVLVPFGLDANMLDPLARQMLHSDAFRAIATRLRQLGEELCDGRLVLLHEGGYSNAYVPFCGLAAIEGLAGIRTDVQDPFLDAFTADAYQDLQPHQEAVINAAVTALDAAALGPSPATQGAT